MCMIYFLHNLDNTIKLSMCVIHSSEPGLLVVDSDTFVVSLTCPYVVFVLILYPSYRIMSHPPLSESGGVAIVVSVTVTAHSFIP